MRLFPISLLTLIPVTTSIIRGINFFGLDTEHRDLMCLWEHPLDWHLDKIHDLGFTHIRLPFSYDYILENNWGRMDELFAKTKLNITLDFHRVRNTHQSPRPDAEITLPQFIDGWKTIIRRYINNPRLEAVDIFNEWQSDDWSAWSAMAREIVTSLEAEFPNRLKYYVGGTNWGGLTHFIDLSDLPFASRIFLTIHKYHFYDSQPLEERWDWSFGPNKPIINVGEWGFMSDKPDQVAWATRFIDWLISQGIRDSYFWTWSFNSGDTGGILKEDCTTLDQTKMNLLLRYWAGIGRNLRHNYI